MHVRAKVESKVPIVDPKKLEQFMQQFICDMGAAMGAALVLIGDELGLYRALADAESPLSPKELAERTATDPRYVQEWLAAEAAANYVVYDKATGKYAMTPEQAFALAYEDSPGNITGAFQVVSAIVKDQHKITEAFRGGSGVGWHEHHPSLFLGTERFFRPNYANYLVSSWLPALKGVVPKLKKGAKVTDVGCGHGSSTILMAKAFRNSEFWGFDYHQASIETARLRARKEGVASQIHFVMATAKQYPGENYDLVAFFDCLHDMGDPVGAAKHVKETLAKDGTWMIVEPFAHDKVEDNLNPMGRVFYAASTMICTPASRSQEVGLALGAQAGPAKIEEVVRAAGFSHFHQAAETPFNRVFEAKV
jgi:2-polyprenyl-3-methyl-5-hydroxy-6-metoxy-1,4-benzoquinol methylase